MIRSLIATLLVLLAVVAVSGFADLDHTPIGPFIIDQNTTFIYDFNATYTNGSPGQVPEDGVEIIYDLSSEDLSEISGSSEFSFNSTSGLLNYTPSNADSTKNFTILFLLREPGDEGPVLDSLQPRFDIQNINDPPQITSSSPASPVSVSENGTLVLTINATDPDGPYGEVLNATWTLERPTNGSYTETAQFSTIPGQGLLNYTVGFCDAGTIDVNGSAIDVAGSNDTVSWTVNVANVNRNVTFNDTANISNQTFAESIGIVANFTYDEFFRDPDDLVCQDETLTFTLDGASDTNLSINTTTGEVVFNATPFWSGNETVTITATDAGGSNVTSNNFTIIVTAIPDDPIGIDPGNQTGYEDVPFEMYVRFEDPDLPFGDNLTYTLNDTSMGTSTLSLNEFNRSGNRTHVRLNLTPLNADIGVYHYRLVANDTTGREANVTFTIDIEPNAAPTIDTITIPNATQDALYSVLVNGTEPDGEAISWFATIIASNGSLPASALGTYNATIDAYAFASVNDSQGNLSFTPTNGHVGNYTISIIAVDEKGARANETTQLHVLNVNDPPYDLTPADEDLKAKTDIEWNYTASVDDPDFPYGDFVTISVNDSDITITNTTGTGSDWFMEWTPTAGDIGNRTIELNATDAAGASITETFTLEILAPAGPTILPIENLTAQESVEYVNRIQVNDPNGDPITITFNESVWNSSVQSSGDDYALINATYGSGAIGNYSITVTAYDAIDNLSDSVTVDFTIEPFNLPPNLTDARSISFVAGNATTYNFTVFDAEDNAWDAYFENATLPWLNVTRVNQTFLQISGAPNTSHIGLTRANLTINQTDYPPRSSTYEINVTVFTDPQAPEITARTPTFGLNPSDTEGDSRTYSVNVDDPNFPGPGTNESDAVTIEWTFNGETMRSNTVNATTNDEYVFEYDYCTAPGGTLEVVVTDLFNLSDSTSWEIDIENVNRAPYFGEKRFSYDVVSNSESLSYQTGSWAYVNVVDTSSELEQFNETAGTITSAVYDLGRENSINKARIVNISTSGNGPVTYEVRFNTNSPNPSDPSWSGWTDPVSIGSAPSSNYTIRQYVQMRFTLNSTNPLNLASIENVTLNYAFANQTLESSSTYFDYYYLDDYFTDPDFIDCGNDTITTSVDDNPPELVMETDEQSRTVDIITDTSFGYTHPASFVYTDSTGANVTSNTFGLEVIERPDQINEPQPTSGGGGGGGSSTAIITEPEEIDVPDPEPLELITPGSVTMYENETLSIPISVVNRWNETLENVALSATSENENTTIELEIDEIASLETGENRTFNLTVTSYARYGDYALQVFATVDDPEYNESATILISSIELGQQGEETFNTKLTFTRDIVESNPRCLELNEQIERARELITGGATQEAATLLDDIVENCRYLISLDDESLAAEEDTPWHVRAFDETSTETKVYAAVIVLVNLMLILLVASYVLKTRKKKPTSDET